MYGEIFTLVYKTVVFGTIDFKVMPDLPELDTVIVTPL